MAREFGVKFNFEEMRQDYESGGLKAKRSLKKIKSWKTITEIGKHCNKFYIHPDSLHIFEPKEGDVVMIDRWYWARQRGEVDYAEQLTPAFVHQMGNDENWLSISTQGIGYDNWIVGTSKPRIKYETIQRDNKAFFWPEVEA